MHKIKLVNELLEQQPDIVLILEMACAKNGMLLSGHDDYLIKGVNANTNDNQEALGKGVAICYKNTLDI